MTGFDEEQTYWACYSGHSGQRNRPRLHLLSHKTIWWIAPFLPALCHSFPFQYPDVFSFTELSQTTHSTDHAHPVPQNTTSYAPIALCMSLYKTVCHIASVCFHVSIYNAIWVSCSMGGSSLCPRTVWGYCTDSDEKQAYLLYLWYEEVSGSVLEIAKDLFEQTLKTNKGTMTKIINSKMPHEV